MNIPRTFHLIALFIFCLLISACERDNSYGAAAEQPVVDRSDRPVNSGRDDTAYKSGGNQNANFDELVAEYESAERGDWQRPTAVISKLGDLTDKVIADIGAGTGYFTFHFVPLAKRVIAIDIDPRMIEFIEASKPFVPEVYQDVLETRLTDSEDSGLKNNEVDIVFLCNTYTYIDDRVNYFSRIHDLMRPEGLLVIVDYKKRRIPVGPSGLDKVAISVVEKEMEEAGFRDFVSDDQLLPYQYIYIARKSAKSTE